MQVGGSRSSSPTPTASSAAPPTSASQPSASPAPVRHISDVELEAKIEQGKQEKERAEAAKRQAEAKSEIGKANLGAAKAKATGHADTDGTEASRPSAHKAGDKESATSGVHGLKTESSKSKEKAVSGFSLGSGGAHFAPKKDKAKKEPKELTPEQLEKKSLGMLKKH